MITRFSRRGGKLWIRIFPDKPVTFRPSETRMGSGKGNVEFWVSVIRPGKVLFEVSNSSFSISVASLKISSYKIPFKTRIISKKLFI